MSKEIDFNDLGSYNFSRVSYTKYFASYNIWYEGRKKDAKGRITASQMIYVNVHLIDYELQSRLDPRISFVTNQKPF